MKLTKRIGKSILALFMAMAMFIMVEPQSVKAEITSTDFSFDEVTGTCQAKLKMSQK